MTQVPDPFRRFVDTPQRAVVSSGKKTISIESNERAIATCVANFLAVSVHLETVRKIHLVRIVREKDVPSDSARFTCVHSGPILVLLRGCTTSLLLDLALGELLGFVASDVDIKEMEQRLLPAILCGSIPVESAASIRDDKQVTSTASARDNLTQLTN